ncbi:MAG: 2-amino-4-hydroxy-6-hydroxymethyldihydropteridine diphosphokinase [Gammaproteobacteria bacterium]|nr:2-amino-4-hydroxy-6-hydroxymethyldihydropteridine diphosphokinase [Gammaproteobacteria bacterium]NNJ72907.1 2-amino-4-hydroxy-6-hydroxymethyldihydropteridine diphosphokinase [Enterobacterales bacterium]
MTLHKAYIGLGSNLESPEKQIASAIQELQAHPELHNIRASKCYRSKPLAEMAQPDYINAVVELNTHLSAERLLDELQAIEDSHKRDRTTGRWSARTLDLDILLYAKQTIKTERLTVPHYGLKDRDFVIIPLAELDPNLKLPDNTKINDLVTQCSTEGLSRIE